MVQRVRAMERALGRSNFNPKIKSPRAITFLSPSPVFTVREKRKPEECTTDKHLNESPGPSKRRLRHLERENEQLKVKIRRLEDTVDAQHDVTSSSASKSRLKKLQNKMRAMHVQHLEDVQRSQLQLNAAEARNRRLAAANRKLRRRNEDLLKDVETEKHKVRTLQEQIEDLGQCVEALKLRAMQKQRNHRRWKNKKSAQMLLPDLLHIADSKLMSDEACKALASKTDALPSLSMLKKHRNKVNAEIQSELGLNGDASQASVKVDNLIKQVLLPRCNARFGRSSSVRVMVSLDGRKIGRNGNCHSILVGTTVVDGMEGAESEDKLCPLAVWRCGEDHDSIKIPFQKLKQDCLKVKVRGTSIEWFLGGDLKSMLILTGNCRACDKGQSCPHCPADQEGRKVLSNHGKHQQAFCDGKRSAGPRPNLLEGWIDEKHVVTDSLHLLLRTCDCMFERSWIKLSAALTEGVAKVRMEKEMRKLMSHWKMFKPKDQKKMAWSSINGNQRLSVLASFNWENVWPENLSMAKKINQAHGEFHALHVNQTNSWHPTSGKDLGDQLKKFVESLCLSTGGPARRQRGRRIRAGSEEAHSAAQRGETAPFNAAELITVCFHMVHVHIGQLTDLHGSLKPFSMQCLEAGNKKDNRSWNCKNSRRRDAELKEMLHGNYRVLLADKEKKEHQLTCDVCRRGFMKEGNLENHIRKVHSDYNFEHHCEKCKLGFRTTETFKKHIRRKHKVNSHTHTCTTHTCASRS